MEKANRTSNRRKSVKGIKLIFKHLKLSFYYAPPTHKQNLVNISQNSTMSLLLLFYLHANFTFLYDAQQRPVSNCR